MSAQACQRAAQKYQDFARRATYQVLREPVSQVAARFFFMGRKSGDGGNRA